MKTNAPHGTVWAVNQSLRSYLYRFPKINDWNQQKMDDISALRDNNDVLVADYLYSRGMIDYSGSSAAVSDQTWDTFFKTGDYEQFMPKKR